MTRKTPQVPAAAAATRTSETMLTRTSRRTIEGVAAGHLVDARQHPADRALRAGTVLQQHRAERRRERERVDRRDQHGGGDGDGELAEQLARDAGQEGDRHKDRKQHHGDGEDRPGDLGHRLARRLLHRKVRLLLHHPLDVLDHDDRIVDDDADREDEREQRHGVGAVADHQQHREGSDDRHRHGDHRDDRRPELSEEDEDDEGDEREGLDKRVHHRLDRGLHEQRGVVDDQGFEIVGISLGELLHAGGDRLRDVDRVGARSLVDGDRCAGVAVVPAEAVRCLGAELDPRHVPHAHRRAVGIGADDDPLELLGGRQPALRADRELELLVGVQRRGADPAHRGLHVLVLDGAGHLGRAQPEVGECVGIEPDTHRVLERAEQRRVAHAWHALERVDDVDRRVVAQIERVERLVWRIELDDLQQAGGFLLHGEPLPGHFFRQQRFGQRDTVLHVDGVDVGIGAEFEGHRQRVAAVGR